MNRKGVEILRQLDAMSSHLKKIIDNKLFPPHFLTFLSIYKTGNESFSFETIVLDDKVMDKYVLTAGEMYKDVIVDGETYTASIDHLFSADKLLLELNKYQRGIERWNNMGFVQIGLMFHGDVLLLGMEEKNKDEIWRYGQGLLKSVCCKLEDNIFDFFKKLRETIDPDDLKDWNITIEQIYKNFNEDFYRVRR